MDIELLKKLLEEVRSQALEFSSFEELYDYAGKNIKVSENEKTD